MRMLKKLLLAASLVGAVGLLGFASDAKAATDPESVTPSVTDDELSIEWDEPEGTFKSLAVTIGGRSVYIPEDAIDEDACTCEIESIKELINDPLNVGAFASSETLKDLEIKVKVTTSKGSVSYPGKEDDPVIAFDSESDEDPLYRVSVSTTSGFSPIITLDGTDYSQNYVYAFPDDDVEISVKENEEYGFTWTIKPKSGSAEKETGWIVDWTVDQPVAFTGTAVRTSPIVTLAASKTKVTVKSGKAAEVKLTWTVKGDLKIKSGTKVQLLVDGAAHSQTWETGTTGGSHTITISAARTYVLSMTGTYVDPIDGLDKTWTSENEVTIVASEAGDATKVTTTDFPEYCTQGDYTFKFTAKAENGSTDFEWIPDSDSEKYVKEVKQGSTDSKGNTTFELRFNTDKLENGNKSATIKFTCEVDGVEANIDSTSSTTKSLTLYSTPSSSFTKTDYSIKYDMPKAVNTGETDGKESDSSSSTATKVKEVSQAYIKIGVDSSEATDAKKSGQSSTLDATTLHKVLDDLSSKKKLTSDSHDVTFRMYPADSSVHNKNVYTEVTEKVYKVVIRYTESSTGSSKTTTTTSDDEDSSNSGRRSTTSAAYALPVASMNPAANLVATASTTTTGAVKEIIVYRFEGEKVKLSDLGVTGTWSTLTNGTEDVATKGELTVSSTASRNVYTGVLGARSSSGGSASANDSSVGKWGQNNMPVYLMIAIVVATAVFGMAAYDKKKKNF
ncbi:MAG: hypothetical protein IK111_00310 [Lachnospiraceae bacterium]|nr:hypothetical protein [Lachnospiraceae bacterium]